MVLGYTLEFLLPHAHVPVLTCVSVSVRVPVSMFKSVCVSAPVRVSVPVSLAMSVAVCV